MDLIGRELALEFLSIVSTSPPPPGYLVLPEGSITQEMGTADYFNLVTAGSGEGKGE